MMPSSGTAGGASFKSSSRIRPSVSKLLTWTCEDVKLWMIESGFGQYASLFADKHKVDGISLLSMREQDLRQTPLQLNVLGDIKRINYAITNLVEQFNCSKKPIQLSMNMNMYPTSSLNGSVTKPHSTIISNNLLFNEEWFIANVEAPDNPGSSWLKALIACVYCMISLLVTAFVMVIVHDRVPDMKTYPPLPDIFLDNVPLIPWAFQVCEIIACCLAFIWCLVLIFHKWRLVLFRRMFSLTGTVFALRCVTMIITSMSVPGVHLDCKSPGHLSWTAKFKQAFDIWLGMGLSLRGVRSCGDYMFSGHTTAITLLNHFITEYTPDDWKVLSTFTWVLNLFGIFFILAGHEHYSIDVFVAFYLSSRIFLYYHLMANHIPKEKDGRARIWFPLFWFFESGTHGRVPHEYDWPFKYKDMVHWGYAMKHRWNSGEKEVFEDDDKLVEWIEGVETKEIPKPDTFKPVKRKSKKIKISQN